LSAGVESNPTDASGGRDDTIGCFAAVFHSRELLYDVRNRKTVDDAAASIDGFIFPLLKLCGGARIYGSDYPTVQIDEPDVRAFSSVAKLRRGVVHLPETSREVTHQMARFWFGGFTPAPRSFVRRGTPLFVCQSCDALALDGLLGNFAYFTAIAGLSNLGHPARVAREVARANDDGLAVVLNALSTAIFFVGRDLWNAQLLEPVRQATRNG
jgi:hypothetical protein